MTMNKHEPTQNPGINAIVNELLSSVQTILGSHFVGMYLEGSLTSDDFDQASDIDFIVVTDEEISDNLFEALYAMHERIAALNSPWATELEGSYIDQHALRRFDKARAIHPNIERGPTERLKRTFHDSAWIIHRYIMRERGITLAGPAPHSLIDPISPADLRGAMVAMAPGWLSPLLQNPSVLEARGYQSYVVLSLCRILYTLENGMVVSKRVAAQWAQETLGEPWIVLIESALEGRHKPAEPASPTDLQGTFAFIRYTLDYVRQRNHHSS